MAKVLLVEDDNNLREIFEMRLQAEGYQTVTASDGELGLSVAMKEKPDLIIADVMMPKLSGFEMLETLRSSPEMKNVKVVMMTALGAAEDIGRGEKLNVAKYLVKSQVTLEDFVRVVREVLSPEQSNQSASTGAQPATPQAPTTPPAEPPSAPAMPTNPVAVASTPATPPDNGQMTASQQSSNIQSQIDSFAAGQQTPAQPATPPEQTISDDSPNPSVNIPVSTPPNVDPAPPGPSSPQMPA